VLNADRTLALSKVHIMAGEEMTSFWLAWAMGCCGAEQNSIPPANRAQRLTLNEVSETLSVEMCSQSHRQRQLLDSAATLMAELKREMARATMATPYEDDPKYEDLRALALEAARNQQKAEQAAARGQQLASLVEQLHTLSNRASRQPQPLAPGDCSQLLHQLRLMTEDEALVSLACVAGQQLYSGGLTNTSVNSFDGRVLQRHARRRRLRRAQPALAVGTCEGCTGSGRVCRMPAGCEFFVKKQSSNIEQFHRSSRPLCHVARADPDVCASVQAA